MASNPSLDVSTIEMAGWRVAYLTYQTSQTSGDFDHAIRRTFDRVKTWVREQGGTVDTVPAIGIASVQDGKLQSYECCIPISENLSPDEDSALDVKVLPGGKYVIVKIEKQSEIIGETIRRFFEEYVPNTNLQIDNSRPTYEVYWNTTMDFCVPILVGICKTDQLFGVKGMLFLKCDGNQALIGGIDVGEVTGIEFGEEQMKVEAIVGKIKVLKR